MKHVALTYMRANPITREGHEKVYNRVVGIRGAEPHIFLSTSHDSKKNPLAPEDKLRFAKKIFKAADVQLVKGGYIEALKKVSPTDKVTIIVGGDRVEVIETLANKYNHKDFDFEEIEIVNAGGREGNAISASKMRALAAEGKEDEFVAELSNKLTKQEKHEMYQLTREGMNLDEQVIAEAEELWFAWDD